MISAVVPTLAGQARLDRNLPSVAASLEQSGEPWEIVVVDDGGGAIEPRVEHARTVSLPRNLGYGPAVNAGAHAARGEYLLVLNDDVRLEPATVRVLREAFPRPELFAVVPRIRSPLAACGDEGGKSGAWEAGLLEIRELPRVAGPRPALYAVGCCFLCPRACFLELGGYDPVYAPFLWEDVDLGYRAWRRGWRILYLPQAACDHEGSATLSETRSLEERERISFRNRVLFHLLNLQDPGRRAELFGALAAHALLEPRLERLDGLREALALFEAAPRRPAQGLSDAEILLRVEGH